MTARTKPVASPVRPALPELRVLAAAMRPDWNIEAFDGALVLCHQRGWPWPHTLTETVRVLCDPAGRPRDISAAAASPVQRRVPPPDVYERGAAAARAALGQNGKPLIDPDCRDGKCGSCVGGPCEHECHNHTREDKCQEA